MKGTGTFLLVLGVVLAVLSILFLIDRSHNFSTNPPEVCLTLAIIGAGTLIAGAMLAKR